MSEKVIQIKKHFHPNTDKVDVQFVLASHDFTYKVAYWRGLSLGMLIGFVVGIYIGLKITI